MTKRQYNPAQVNSEANNMLLRAQVELEDAHGCYAEAADLHTDAETAYIKEYGAARRRLREAGHAVGELKGLAMEETVALHDAMQRALNRKKRFERLIDIIMERINTIKFIARRTDVMAERFDGGH